MTVLPAPGNRMNLDNASHEINCRGVYAAVQAERHPVTCQMPITPSDGSTAQQKTP